MLLTAAGSVIAGPPEQKLLAELQSFSPTTRFGAIHLSPVPGVYEVWMGANVGYVSAKNPRYILFGHLVDLQTLTDLTAPKLAVVNQLQVGGAQSAAAKVAEAPPLRIPVASLPLGDAIKTVRGNGSRTLYVFSDPACPYCKKLEPELQQIRDVTIYTFVVPFLGRQLPQAVWCAADRDKTWQAWMLNGDRSGLAEGAACATPIDRNAQLAQRYGVNGTPTLVFADGSRASQFVKAAVVEERLSLASRSAGAPGEAGSPGARSEDATQRTLQ